jgi:methionine-rich copper-binding protein CopC
MSLSESNTGKCYPNTLASLGWGKVVLFDYYRHMKLKRTFTALFLTLATSLFPMTSAFAHTDLVSTSPVDGSVNDVPPAIISITFSEPPITEGAAIILSDASGAEFPVGEVTFEGAKVSVTSAPDLPPNEYLVTWRISAEDGHVLTGEFNFTYSGELIISPAEPIITAYGVDSENPLGVSAESAIEEKTNPWVLFVSAIVIGLIVGTLIIARNRK